jgi:hypothetical protein
MGWFCKIFVASRPMGRFSIKLRPMDGMGWDVIVPSHAEPWYTPMFYSSSLRNSLLTAIEAHTEVHFSKKILMWLRTNKVFSVLVFSLVKKDWVRANPVVWYRRKSMKLSKAKLVKIC